MVDWAEQAKEYSENYEDDSKIYAWARGLVSDYYSEIYESYHRVIGTPLGIEIKQEHVGLRFDQIMSEHIGEEYAALLMEEYRAIEEEE